MADYKLNGPDESNGVIRNADGANIPNTVKNKDWKEYEKWRDAGGVPDPQYTQAEIDAMDLDQQKAALQQQINAATGEILRFSDWMYDVLRANNTIKDTDETANAVGIAAFKALAQLQYDLDGLG